MDGVPGPVNEEARNVEKHIESCPIRIREIIEKLRSIAKAGMPGAHEFLYHDAITYQLSKSPGTWICYISPQRNYVRLGFFFGNNLIDPMKLLDGTGKRMRHVKVRTAGEAGTDDLADLIRGAWADAKASD